MRNNNQARVRLGYGITVPRLGTESGLIILLK